jgi:hypothetical protein
MTRPLSLTVIAWVIIALSVEGLITLFGGIATPVFTSGTVETGLSLSATLWAAGIALLANLILAVLILVGFGWARIAYVVVLALGVAGMLLHRQPISLAVMSGLKLVVFSYFFFRRESNEYFAKVSSGAA